MSSIVSVFSTCKDTEKIDAGFQMPEAVTQDYIHEKYMTELVMNRIVPETKNQLLLIVKELQEKESIKGLILGGTELPLILSQTDFEQLELFDTTQIHVESIVTRMIEPLH